MKKRKNASGNRVHIELENTTSLQSPNSDNYILSIVNGLRDLILANIDALQKNDAATLSNFAVSLNETISRNSSRHILSILQKHGFSIKNGWIKSFKDFDSLLTSLTSLYLTTQNNILIESNILPSILFPDTFIRLVDHSLQQNCDLIVKPLYEPKTYSITTVVIKICIVGFSKLFHDIHLLKAVDISDRIIYSSELIERIYEAIYSANADGKKFPIFYFIIFYTLTIYIL